MEASNKTVLKTNPTDKWWQWKGHAVDIQTISPSGASSWQTCGLQWRLSHIDRLEVARPQLWMALGTAFHKSMEPVWLGRSRQPQFKQQWQVWRNKKLEYKEGESWTTWLARGANMTAALTAVVQGKFDPTQTKIEVPDNVDLGFVTLTRRLDVITVAKKLPVLIAGRETKIDGYCTIDMKTSSQRYSDKAILQSQQLMTYAVPSKTVDWANLSVYAVVTKAADPKVQLIGKRYEKKEVAGQIARLLYVAERIRKGDFPQFKGDHCGYCQFESLCYDLPGWQSKYHAKPERPPKHDHHPKS